MWVGLIGLCFLQLHDETSAPICYNSKWFSLADLFFICFLCDNKCKFVACTDLAFGVKDQLSHKTGENVNIYILFSLLVCWSESHKCVIVY